MTRRFRGDMTGEQYCANTAKREVHDLDSESGSCQIDKIIAAGNDRPYHTLASAKRDGHDNCHWCLGESER